MKFGTPPLVLLYRQVSDGAGGEGVGGLFSPSTPAIKPRHSGAASSHPASQSSQPSRSSGLLFFSFSSLLDNSAFNNVSR